MRRFRPRMAKKNEFDVKKVSLTRILFLASFAREPFEVPIQDKYKLQKGKNMNIIRYTYLIVLIEVFILFLMVR